MRGVLRISFVFVVGGFGASLVALLSCGDGHPPASTGSVDFGREAGSSTPTSDGGRVVDAGEDRRAKQVVVGRAHACALTVVGKVYCWGDNTNGQLGDAEANPAEDEAPAAPRAVALPATVKMLAAGADHTCALTDDARVHCWGDNAVGQLANGTQAEKVGVVEVVAVAGATHLASSDQTTCIVDAAGGAACWGHNVVGQVGDGTLTDRFLPTAVKGLASGVRATAPGGDHTCALGTDETVYCWGDNLNGALGNGSTVSSPTYVVSDAVGGIAALGSGIAFSCALSTAGGVSCWGYGGKGQLGHGEAETKTSPVPTTGLDTGVAAFAVGGSHACAIRSDGSLVCWGENTDGQIGDGTTTNRFVPIQVTALGTSVVGVGAGEGTCAVTSNGAVHCWGDNRFGQVGDGTRTPRSVPTQVSGLL